jgi:hypothetical protein
VAKELAISAPLKRFHPTASQSGEGAGLHPTASSTLSVAPAGAGTFSTVKVAPFQNSARATLSFPLLA